MYHIPVLLHKLPLSVTHFTTVILLYKRLIDQM